MSLQRRYMSMRHQVSDISHTHTYTRMGVPTTKALLGSGLRGNTHTRMCRPSTKVPSPCAVAMPCGHVVTSPRLSHAWGTIAHVERYRDKVITCARARARVCVCVCVRSWPPLPAHQLPPSSCSSG